MENGELRIENRELRIENGELRMENYQLSILNYFTAYDRAIGTTIVDNIHTTGGTLYATTSKVIYSYNYQLLCKGRLYGSGIVLMRIECELGNVDRHPLQFTPYELGQDGVVDIGIAVVLYAIHGIVAVNLFITHRILAMPLEQHLECQSVKAG